MNKNVFLSSVFNISIPQNYIDYPQEKRKKKTMI